ncbi:LuxR C-terminal-related transcriptional regulator [Arthrobacter sp. NPDC089319]|uniref:LuxR C-terminal-related transcriptional regulator n=1 Tax=Arthrobacter sp. NPDC089319 TaxID=3155915 RepID=UPI0034438BD0
MIKPSLKWRWMGSGALYARLEECVVDQQRGAVVVGEHGSGKSALVNEMLRRHEDAIHIVRLRGSATGQATPYEAFNVLLSRLPDEVLSQPMRIFVALAALIESDSAGRPVVIVVDKAETLDEYSAETLVRLTASGSATPVVMVRELANRPELTRLWKDTGLLRIDIPPLTLEESVAALESALGAPVSWAAATLLWDVAGGNPLFLKELAREQVAKGSLFEQDGFWICRDEPLHLSGGVVEAVTTRLGKLSQEQRMLLDAAALAEGLPLTQAIQWCGQTQIDELEAKGMLETVPGRHPVVRPAGRLLAEAIRASVPGARARALLQRVEETAYTGPGAAFAAAKGRLNFGMALDADSATVAAEQGLEAGNHLDALRLIRATGDNREWRRCVVEFRALVGLGRYKEAEQLLADIPAPGSDIPLLVELAMARAQLARAEGDREAESRLLADARRAVCARKQEGARTSLLHQLDIARAEMECHYGYHAAALEEIERLYGAVSPDEDRMRVGFMLAEAWSFTGRPSDGQELASRLKAGERSHQTADATLFSIGLLSGGWTRQLHLLAGDTHVGQTRRYAEAVLAQLAEGLDHVHSGHAVAALQALLPVLCQLREKNVHHTRPLAAAAAAYAYCQLGDLERARQLQAEPADGGPWSVATATAYLKALCAAHLESPAKATAGLAGQARDVAARGATTAELLALSAAARLGSVEAAEQLALTATAVQGPFARFCEYFGKGLSGDDPDSLLRAVESAAGNDLLAFEAARSAVSMATVQGDATCALRARDVMVDCRSRLGQVQSAPQGRRLTAREHDVARLAAAGLADRDIARSLSLSIRTVESHLHQTYAKLNVCKRSQLSGVL